jgi:aldose 1-epimerase
VVELRAGAARVVLDETHGGRIQRLVVDGQDLLVPPDLDERNYGAFPMAPWAGRIRHGRFAFDGTEYAMPCNAPPHAIHGIVRDRRWRVEQASATAAALSVALDAPWPFGGRVVQRAELSRDTLDLTLEVHAGDRPMPAACGWHPWWYRVPTPTAAPLELELHADVQYVRDDAGIPTGEVGPIKSPPWDDCFTQLGTPTAVLEWPGTRTVRLETDCACVVVFTEPEHAVCVEPQSGPPDGFNFDPHVVTPDAPLVVHTAFHWSEPG